MTAITDSDVPLKSLTDRLGPLEAQRADLAERYIPPPSHELAALPDEVAKIAAVLSAKRDEARRREERRIPKPPVSALARFGKAAYASAAET